MHEHIGELEQQINELELEIARWKKRARTAECEVWGLRLWLLALRVQRRWGR